MRFWAEYGKHIEAVIVILLLITVWYSYNKNNKLQKEIKENCGWGEEDYYCYCEKSEASRIKNLLENNSEINILGGDYVKLDR
jgi:hypothetical protein